MKIQRVHGREILDSRGNPTIEVDVTLDGGVGTRRGAVGGVDRRARSARARDGDKKRYRGKGVLKAVANVNGEIATGAHGPRRRSAGDRRADDRPRRHAEQGPARRQRHCSASRWRWRAPARSPPDVPLYAHLARLFDASGTTSATLLPVPMMNILNGGAHADSSVDFQEFMVMPLGAASFADAVRTGAEIFHTLRGILKKKGYATGVGDEGGFAPSLKSNREAVDVVLEAIAQAGFKAGRERSSSRSTSPRASCGTRAGTATSSRSPATRPARPKRWSRSTRTGSANTRSSRSRTASPKATGKAGSS